MNGFDVTFHPGWWSKRGFSFDEPFFLDADHRLECDRAMRRVLYEEYGHAGLGERDPAPRPIMDSDLLAGEYLQAQILGCEISFYPDKLPYTHPMDIEDEKLAALTPPNLEEGVFAAYDKQFKYLLGKFGRVESCIDLHGVQNLALAVRGSRLFEDYSEAPESARLVLSVAYVTVARVARVILAYTRQIGAGVSGAVKLHDPGIYLTSNCSCEMISAADYLEHVFVWDEKLAQEFRPFGVHHCGASMQRLAGAYSRLMPDFIEVGAYSDIPGTLGAFAKNTRVNLRFSPVALLRETPSQIREAVSRIKEQAEASGFDKYTLSVVGVDSETPRESIEAFMSASE